MSKQSESWGAFSPEVAAAYLKTFGHPALGSKHILLDVMRSGSSSQRPTVLDLGCGNGQLYEFFKSNGWQCDYTGIDFSDALLSVARKQNPEALFIKGDVNQITSLVTEKYDFVIFSHVIEIL